MPKPLKQLENRYRSRALRNGNKEQPINLKSFHLQWNIPLIRKDINKATLPFPCTLLNNNVLRLQKPPSGTLCQLQVKSRCCFIFPPENITPKQARSFKESCQERGDLHGFARERRTLEAHGGLSRYLPLINLLKHEPFG